MKYLTLAVASDAEADRLIEDLLQHPNEPLRTPHWGNAVFATLKPVELADSAEPAGRQVLG